MTSAAADDARAKTRFAWLRRGGALDDGTAGPRQMSSRLLIVLALMVVAAIAICTAIGYRLAWRLDEREHVLQRAQLTHALDEYRGMLADITLHLANDVAAARADGKPPAAIAAQLAPLARSRFRFAEAFLLDERRIAAAAYPEGAALPEAVRRLADGFPAESAAGAAAPRAASVDIVSLGEGLGLVALATADGGGFVLATVVPFDARLIALLEHEAGIEGLRLNGEPDAKRATRSLIDGNGRIVGWLSWDSRHPVIESLGRLMPLMAIVAACFIAFAVLVIHQVRRERPGAAAEVGDDPLTHLPNRERLFDILDETLAARAAAKSVMLAFLNVDNFKDINDAFGHRGGDFLLAAIAARLKEMLPASAVAGRIGGDEFAVVMTADSPVEAVETANAAMNAIAQPFRIANQAAQVSVSVGLALAPRDGDSRDELARRADLALRTAKRRGRGHVVGFQLEFEQEFHDRRFIMRGLRRALAEESLNVFYQPILTGDGQHMTGVEALLRWRHRTRGDIPPEVFVPIAEQAGLMPQLGEYVLRRALADAARWKSLYIAVNLSPLQVRDPTLVDLVASVLKQTGTPAARVVLEVTEGVLIDEPEKAIKRLEKLRALGVKIALDDFGSGYSSLRYLQRFPIDKLKIDKSFVAALGHSESGNVIIQAMIALGHALGVKVLAEGVETEEQRVLLRLAGCDELQGHLLGRPLPAADIDALLAKSAQQPARA